MKDRFGELLAKGKKGNLTPGEMKELAHFLNEPVLGPLLNSHVRTSSKRPSNHRSPLTAEALNEFLDRITAAPLFEYVGKPIDDDGVQTVASWKACLKSMEGYAWINMWTSVMNRIFANACEARGEDWFDREWNSLVDARKKLIGKRLKPALKRVMKPNDLPIRFEYSVVGDVLTATLLQEFEDEASQFWSDQVIRWLLAGHVPCGFSGELPEETANDPDPLPIRRNKNRLIVY
jgi:hypothetical protein